MNSSNINFNQNKKILTNKISNKNNYINGYYQNLNSEENQFISKENFNDFFLKKKRENSNNDYYRKNDSEISLDEKEKNKKFIKINKPIVTKIKSNLKNVNTNKFGKFEINQSNQITEENEIDKSQIEQSK